MITQVLSELVEWSKDRPLWQRHALHRLCVINDFTDNDILALVGICKQNTSDITLFSMDDIQIQNQGEKVTLKSIQNVENVNALAKDQTLQFYPSGLIIVYGDNGSGKTGYIRILKQICRARNPKNETILPNIYEVNPGVSTAKITFVANNSEYQVDWIKDKATSSLLSSISVFDSTTANIHVETTNDVAYVPYPMELLRKLVNVCISVKQKFQDEINIIKSQTPAALKLPKCHPNSPVGLIINNLKDTTSIEKIHQLAALSEVELKRREQLIIDLSVDSNKILRDLNNRLSKLNELTTLINQLVHVISDKSYSDLAELKKTYEVSKKTANVAASELFKDEPLPNIGGDVWKTLWESAKKYSEEIAYIGQSFPVTQDANCVLCQQIIEPQAAQRLNKFNEFIADDAKRKEKISFTNYQKHLDFINSNNISIKKINELVSFIAHELDNQLLSEKLRKFLIKTKWRLRSIIKLKLNLPTLPDFLNTNLEIEQNNLKQRISDLSNVNDTAHRQLLIEERTALDDRVWLEIVKNDVIEEIHRKKQIKQLEDFIKQTSTTPITAKISDISEILVTNALRAQFAKEIASLKISSLAIELNQEKSSYGSAQFKVILTRNPSVKVGQVLSEGEFRCIALAAFLAELATTNSESAIIFDDPVSSLDHRHREAVSERLAQEGLKRQVIVFTHNLEFLYLLDDACRRYGTSVNYRHITKLPDNSETGLCHNDAPPKAQNVKNRIISIEHRLKNEKIHYESGNETEWEKTVRSLQEDLRFTWERAVEDVLKVVLSRFSNKVDTKGLTQLTALTIDDCKDMRNSYGRISKWMHSDGIGLNRNLPVPNDIENEIEILKKWHSALKEKQTKIKN
jgi:energy-coupling factor transporter ATP-binding protein EcfA2